MKFTYHYRHLTMRSGMRVITRLAHTGQSKPSSLQNIFKELHEDLGCPIPKSGSLVKVRVDSVLGVQHPAQVAPSTISLCGRAKCKGACACC